MPGLRGEIDLLLPALGVAVEYDGWYWHRSRVVADTRKSSALSARGWTVVRIRETSASRVLPPIDGAIMVVCSDFEPAAGVAERAADIVERICVGEEPHKVLVQR
jgi:very-short-patch-repair endonuclease